MSPALPVLKAKDCLRVLLKAGFRIDHRRGSHARLFHSVDRTRKVTIPIHNKDLPPGTLKAILRQAGLSVEEFLDLLD
jgi:predicted RNA binding protein YcfA (HicA-like mRNA interferase family)